jgi:hypothetical protein
MTTKKTAKVLSRAELIKLAFFVLGDTKYGVSKFARTAGQQSIIQQVAELLASDCAEEAKIREAADVAAITSVGSRCKHYVQEPEDAHIQAASLACYVAKYVALSLLDPVYLNDAIQTAGLCVRYSTYGHSLAHLPDPRKSPQQSETVKAEGNSTSSAKDIRSQDMDACWRLGENAQKHYIELVARRQAGGKIFALARLLAFLRQWLRALFAKIFS